MTTTSMNCRLNCLICHLSGGKAVASVRCFLRLPRRGALGTKSQGTPCISSNNEVPKRFVGSILRIVLASIAPFFVPTICSGVVSDLPNQIPLFHAVSLLWSLCPDDNPRCSGAKILNKNVSREFSVIRCSERCDATRSTYVSRDTKPSVSNHPWPVY